MSKNKLWTARRKLEAMIGILHGWQSIFDASIQHEISEPEILEWIGKYKAHGFNGLKATKRFRDLDDTPNSTKT